MAGRMLPPFAPKLSRVWFSNPSSITGSRGSARSRMPGACQSAPSHAAGFPIPLPQKVRSALHPHPHPSSETPAYTREIRRTRVERRVLSLGPADRGDRNAGHHPDEQHRTVTTRPLKIDHALKALPEVDDLGGLREALIGVSREDRGQAWSAAAAYATLDGRLADTAALEARIAALADEARQRVDAVMRHSLAALRALESGDEAAAARALVAAGEVEEEAGRVDEAESFFRQALALGRRPRDRSAEGLALRRLGRVARE